MSLLEQNQFATHLKLVAQRWEQALEATGHTAAVICSGANKNYFMDDQAPPFKPNPHFAQFYPGTDTEHCELVFRPGADPLLFVYQPEDYWHLPPSIPDWLPQRFELETHSSLDGLARARSRALKNAVAGANNVAWISPQEPPAHTLPTLAHNPATLIAHLDYLRDQKSGFEVAAMREATRHAVAGHLKAKEAFFAGATEYEIYMAFLAATGNTGGELPYSSIVALNQHGGVLHYQHYERTRPASHLSFLIDAGASHFGYASDITRTYSSAGQAIPHSKEQAPEEFASLIAALDSAQLELVAQIEIGTPYADLHGHMIDRIAHLLVEHKLLKCSKDEAIAGNHADPFMPHGLGHFIGLQTHDVGGQLADTNGAPAPPDERFPALRLTRSVRADSVFTIEPGIYFIPMLLDQVRATKAPINWPLIDALLPCGGIRIEDNIWLSEAAVNAGKPAAVNLTREAFDAV